MFYKMKVTKNKKLTFRLWLRDLERKRIISRKPHPLVPFILTLAILIIGMLAFNSNLDVIYATIFFIIGAFTFAFAIFHWMIILLLRKRR